MNELLEKVKLETRIVRHYILMESVIDNRPADTCLRSDIPWKPKLSGELDILVEIYPTVLNQNQHLKYILNNSEFEDRNHR